MEIAQPMLPYLHLPTLVGCRTPAAAPEPDGSRTLGIVPPYRAEPAPPDWLRSTSHALVTSGGPNTKHYLYEVYSDRNSSWLVRYLRFPADGEELAETQVVFVFSSDPLAKPCPVQPAELQVRTRNARWRETEFVLVDRRDLILTRGPSPRSR